MKSVKILLLIIGVVFITNISYAQTSVFSTPEGFKWGMTRNQVLKLNYGKPTKSDNEMIYYLNRETMNSLLYKFSNNKLISITKKYGFETEDELVNDFEKYKKQLIALYGSNFKEIAFEQFVWVYKNTRIMLFNSYDNDKMKVFITYEKITNK